tara:strand:+ start:847 stop:1095 length:249 start_codon:yes stop_codon:yes gene_type:complete
MSMSDFDIVFDEICSDVFPKITAHITEHDLVTRQGNVDTHECTSYLTDIEGFDTDMSLRIFQSYTYDEEFRDLLRKATADGT